MTKNLNIIEEYDILELIETPELSCATNSIFDRKKIAKNILSRDAEEIFLINKTAFQVDSVFAGLTEKHIEYFAKHAPVEYKKELVKIFADKELIDGVWEIVKSMDDDEGDGSTKNQDRVKRVIQYVQDNRIIFQF